MKKQQLTFTFSVLSLLAGISMSYAQIDSGNTRVTPQGGCASKGCLKCNQFQFYCLECDDDFYLDKFDFCQRRKEFEYRGDSMSSAVGLINIILIVIVFYSWQSHSRTYFGKCLRLNQEQIQQQNMMKAQAITQLQSSQTVRPGAQNEQLVQLGQPIQFNNIQPEKPLVKLEGLTDQQQQNQQIDATSYPLNFPVQMPNQETTGQQSQAQQNGYPVQQNNQFLQQGNPTNQIAIPPGLQQFNEQQLPQKGITLISVGLNGYWLTQAGKFSLENFSSFNRIKHVMLNFFILEYLMAYLLAGSERRGDDPDSDGQKKLLFLAFFIVMVVYWFITLLPPFVIRVLSLGLCLKNNPNGRPANIFISLLFYIASILILIATENIIYNMDGFESQVWILLVLAGFMLVVFFDKKSVEFAKEKRGGCMEFLLKFRKIDFL